ncbi:hypothetical protein FSST1_012674 [Fusarium sambucinum]
MWCGCGLSMDHGNCATAVDMLKAQFSNSDGGVGELTQAWYSIWGDVVSFTDCFQVGGLVFFANHFNLVGCILLCRRFPVMASRYADYLGRITDQCGWYVPGTFSPSSIGLSSVDCGYMNYSPDLDFCGNAEIGRHMGDKSHC